MRIPAIVLASSLLVAACIDLDTTGTGGGGGTSGTTTDGGTTTSSLRALDVQGFCARLVNDCNAPTDLQSCVATYAPVRVTEACASLVTTASCAELTSTGSSLSNACFPPCTGALATCNGNGTITVCQDTGTQSVLDCSAACRAQSFSEWSGICGTSYNGQVSDRPQCWCK